MTRPAHHITITIPVLETDRLVLREPREADFEAVAAFYADAERSWGFGGPQTRNEAWRWFASLIGHWALRDFGFWMVETRDGGETVGMVGLWEPEGWPEPELGWVMFASGEGKGYAYEAAIAARDHVFRDPGWPTAVSYVDPANARSIALAERLGAVRDLAAPRPDPADLVYRHPAPQVRP